MRGGSAATLALSSSSVSAVTSKRFDRAVATRSLASLATR